MIRLRDPSWRAKFKDNLIGWFWLIFFLSLVGWYAMSIDKIDLLCIRPQPGQGSCQILKTTLFHPQAQKTIEFPLTALQKAEAGEEKGWTGACWQIRIQVKASWDFPVFTSWNFPVFRSYDRRIGASYEKKASQINSFIASDTEPSLQVDDGTQIWKCYIVSFLLLGCVIKLCWSFIDEFLSSLIFR
jgi:hypothetical protein